MLNTNQVYTVISTNASLVSMQNGFTTLQGTMISTKQNKLNNVRSGMCHSEILTLLVLINRLAVNHEAHRLLFPMKSS